MLHHFTWTQFFHTAGFCLLIYYLVVILLYYRDALKAFLWKAKSWVMPQVHLTSSTPNTSPTDAQSNTILGAVSTHDAPTLSEAAAIQVAPGKEEDNEDYEITTPETLAAASTPPAFHPGRQAECLEEIKPLLELVSETRMEKDEFVSLLQLIISKYSRTAHRKYQDQIQRFLLDQSNDRLPFELTTEELQSLWLRD